MTIDWDRTRSKMWFHTLRIKWFPKDLYRRIKCPIGHRYDKTTAKFESAFWTDDYDKQVGKYTIYNMPCRKCQNCGMIIFDVGEIMNYMRNIYIKELYIREKAKLEFSFPTNFKSEKKTDIIARLVK